jgi:hypothetical protein
MGGPSGSELSEQARSKRTVAAARDVVFIRSPNSTLNLKLNLIEFETEIDLPFAFPQHCDGVEENR